MESQEFLALLEAIGQLKAEMSSVKAEVIKFKKEMNERVDDLESSNNAQSRRLRSQMADLQDGGFGRPAANSATGPAHSLPLASIVSSGIAGLDLVHRN